MPDELPQLQLLHRLQSLSVVCPKPSWSNFECPEISETSKSKALAQRLMLPVQEVEPEEVPLDQVQPDQNSHPDLVVSP